MKHKDIHVLHEEFLTSKGKSEIERALGAVDSALDVYRKLRKVNPGSAAAPVVTLLFVRKSLDRILKTLDADDEVQDAEDLVVGGEL